MTVFLVVLVVVALTVLTGVLSRIGSRKHQEDLNTHEGDSVGGPKRDRPAGPEAEAMGVDGSGEPGLRGDG